MVDYRHSQEKLMTSRSRQRDVWQVDVEGDMVIYRITRDVSYAQNFMDLAKWK